MIPRPPEPPPPAPRRPPAARRYAVIAAMVAVPLLTGVTGYVIGRGGFRPAKPAPTKTDQDVLTALHDYDPVHETDDRGRVVRLKLEGRQVDDAALDEAVKLTAMKSLSLWNSSVTDAGIIKLAGLKRLEDLGITDTHITNVGLGQLAGMTSLRNVWVTTNDRLTRSGVDGLRKALPGIQVHVMNEPKKDPPAPARVTTTLGTKK